MNIKAVVSSSELSGSGTGIQVRVGIYDSTDNQIDTFFAQLDLGTELVHGVTTSQIFTYVKNKITTYATNNSYTLASNDFYWPNLNPDEFASLQSALQVKAFTNNASRSFVTTAAAANGFQLSSTRDAVASYSVQVSTTATIGGNASGYVALEIAATNSTTAADWKEIGRVTNSQTISLAIILQSVQISGGILMGVIPSGYYVRLRTVNVSGTPTYTYNSGQEVLI